MDNSSDQLGLESGGRELVSAHELGLAEPLAVDQERGGRRRGRASFDGAHGRCLRASVRIRPGESFFRSRFRSPTRDGGAAFAAGGGAQVDGLAAGGADPQAGLELDVRRLGRVGVSRAGPEAGDDRHARGRGVVVHPGAAVGAQVTGSPLLRSAPGPRRPSPRSAIPTPPPGRASGLSPPRPCRARGRPGRSPGTCPPPAGPRTSPSADGRTGRRIGRSRPPSRRPLAATPPISRGGAAGSSRRTSGSRSDPGCSAGRQSLRRIGKSPGAWSVLSFERGPVLWGTDVG